MVAGPVGEVVTVVAGLEEVEEVEVVSNEVEVEGVEVGGVWLTWSPDGDGSAARKRTERRPMPTRTLTAAAR